MCIYRVKGLNNLESYRVKGFIVLVLMDKLLKWLSLRC